MVSYNLPPSVWERESGEPLTPFQDLQLWCSAVLQAGEGGIVQSDKPPTMKESRRQSAATFSRDSLLLIRSSERHPSHSVLQKLSLETSEGGGTPTVPPSPFPVS